MLYVVRLWKLFGVGKKISFLYAIHMYLIASFLLNINKLLIGWIISTNSGNEGINQRFSKPWEHLLFAGLENENTK